jgi:hypothetical protein
LCNNAVSVLIEKCSDYSGGLVHLFLLFESFIQNHRQKKINKSRIIKKEKYSAPAAQVFVRPGTGGKNFPSPNMTIRLARQCTLWAQAAHPSAAPTYADNTLHPRAAHECCD